MTQFIAVLGLPTGGLPDSITVVPASQSQFLRQASASIFGEDKVADAATVRLGNEDFDVTFLRAQRDMIDGVDFERTDLARFLRTVGEVADQVALWYGNDYGDLEKVKDLSGFLHVVREGLTAPSVETYVRYVRVAPFRC